MPGGGSGDGVSEIISGGHERHPMRLDRGQIEVVDDEVAEVLRRKTPAERIKIGFDMWISARKMLIAHLTRSHPDWKTEKVHKEVARRLSRGSV